MLGSSKRRDEEWNTQGIERQGSEDERKLEAVAAWQQQKTRRTMENTVLNSKGHKMNENR